MKAIKCKKKVLLLFFLKYTRCLKSGACEWGMMGRGLFMWVSECGTCESMCWKLIRSDRLFIWQHSDVGKWTDHRTTGPRRCRRLRLPLIPVPLPLSHDDFQPSFLKSSTFGGFLSILWPPALFVQARETNTRNREGKFTDLLVWSVPEWPILPAFWLSITSWNVKHARQSRNYKSPGVNASPCLSVPQQLRQHRPRPLRTLIDTLSAGRHQ